MNAVVCTSYGPPETLRVQELAMPVPRDNEVLVKVRAAAVNDWDWSLVRGKPYPYRFMFGMAKPRKPIPGIELAGTVEALGDRAHSFAIGDAVYGDISAHGWGTFAEYVCVHEDALALKPASMTFEEAAATSHASMLAWQGLVDAGAIRQGQKVLINGAGGGVGTFGVQIARLYGAEVTGVDSRDKQDMMKSVGFDHVIDYTQEDFTSNGRLYDLILDTRTNRSPFAYLRSLRPHGTYVTVGGHLPRLLQVFLLKRWISGISNKHMHIVGLKPNKDLASIGKLAEEGKVRPVIDGPYTLEDVPRALQYFGDGRHKGKVVISISP